MKLGLLLAMSLPIAFYAQDRATLNEYPNTFSSGSKEVKKFDNQERRFNDWAISVGGGTALISHGDVTSFRDKKVKWGWNAYVSLDKQISHSFGLSLQYQQGQTNQEAVLHSAWGVAKAWTKYKQINLLADVNFSNLLRRTDNTSPYRWAIHGYAGIGLQGYNTHLRDESATGNLMQVEQELDVASFFYQGGLGVKYKISRRIDVEARAMYMMTGDDEFDGGGWESDYTKGSSREDDYPYNYIKKNSSDNFFTVNLGLSFKLGRHMSHLSWHDPLQEIYFRTATLENTNIDPEICEKGDIDNDGVCDDWDRQLTTPPGARVDGAGVALDMDLDGVIDLYDRCVTIPGPAENAGCPANHIH